MPKSKEFKNEYLKSTKITCVPENSHYTKNIPSTYRDSLTTLLELIDNSVDAGSNNIQIIYNDRTQTLTIIDDGFGMVNIDIKDMMKLGYTKERNPNEIGNWGSGFKGACQALSGSNTLVTVLTSTDIETTMIEWEPKISPIDFVLHELEYNNVKGTTVIISNVKKISNDNISKILGLYYNIALFKNPDLILHYNGTKVKAFDPLYRNSTKTVIIKDVVYMNHEGNDIPIPITCATIDEYEPTKQVWWESNKGWSEKKGGVYAVCSNRYIKLGGGFGSESILSNNGHYNRTRIELLIPRELYDVFHIIFNKTYGINIVLNEQTKDYVKKIRFIAGLSSKIKKYILKNEDINGVKPRISIKQIREKLEISNLVLDRYLTKYLNDFKNPKTINPSSTEKKPTPKITTDDKTTPSPKTSPDTLVNRNKEYKGEIKHNYDKLDKKSKLQMDELTAILNSVINNPKINNNLVTDYLHNKLHNIH